MACLPAPSPADAACSPASPAPDPGMLPVAARGSFVPCLAPFPSLPGPVRAAPRPRRRPPRPRAAPRGGASRPAAASRGLPGLCPAGAAGIPRRSAPAAGRERRCPVPAPLFAAGGRGRSALLRAGSAAPAARRALPGAGPGGAEGLGGCHGREGGGGKGAPPAKVRDGGGCARPPGARGAGAGAVGGVTVAPVECPAPTPRAVRVPRVSARPGLGLLLSSRPLLPEPRCVPEPGWFPGGDSAKYHRLPCRDASRLCCPVGDFCSRFRSELFPPAAGRAVSAIWNVLVIQNYLYIACVVTAATIFPQETFTCTWCGGFFSAHVVTGSHMSYPSTWLTHSAALFLARWVFVAVNGNTCSNKCTALPVSTHLLNHLLFSERCNQYTIRP